MYGRVHVPVYLALWSTSFVLSEMQLLALYCNIFRCLRLIMRITSVMALCPPTRSWINCNFHVSVPWCLADHVRYYTKKIQGYQNIVLRTDVIGRGKPMESFTHLMISTSCLYALHRIIFLRTVTARGQPQEIDDKVQIVKKKEKPLQRLESLYGLNVFR